MASPPPSSTRTTEESQGARPPPRGERPRTGSRPRAGRRRGGSRLVWPRVDGEALPVALEAGWPELPDLGRGSGVLGIGGPLVDRARLLGKVDEPEGVVDRDGLHLAAERDRPELANLDGAHAAGAVVLEPVLPAPPVDTACA